MPRPSNSSGIQHSSRNQRNKQFVLKLTALVIVALAALASTSQVESLAPTSFTSERRGLTDLIREQITSRLSSVTNSSKSESQPSASSADKKKLSNGQSIDDKEPVDADDEADDEMFEDDDDAANFDDGDGTVLVNEANDGVDEDAYELVDGNDDDDDDAPRNSTQPNNKPMANSLVRRRRRAEVIEIEDYFGDLVTLDHNRTIVGHKSQARFGPLTITALILGPIVGITLKHALIRGLIWAVGAWLLHLFFPSLLSSLGLGTGLVGMRQATRPEYLAMILPQLLNIPQTLSSRLPGPMRRIYAQYMQAMLPVVDYIRSIPEGPCRHRAVCELGSLIAQQSKLYNSTLRKISATIYINFGTDYSKAWLDGIVNSNCAAKYAMCSESPLAAVTTHLHQVLNQVRNS